MFLEKWIVLIRDAYSAWHLGPHYYSYDLAENEMRRLRAKNKDLFYVVARESHLPELNIAEG